MKVRFAVLVYPGAMEPFDADCRYYLRRAGEERAAAERAGDPRARQTHIALAELYSDAARDRRLARIADRPAEPPSAAVQLLPPDFTILP